MTTVRGRKQLSTVEQFAALSGQAVRTRVAPDVQARSLAFRRAPFQEPDSQRSVAVSEKSPSTVREFGLVGWLVPNVYS